MGFIKGAINAVADPRVFFLLAVVGLAVMVWKRELIASNAVTYGPVGTVLVIQSWLVGVGVVVFGGALVGRLLHEELPRVARALKRRG